MNRSFFINLNSEFYPGVLNLCKTAIVEYRQKEVCHFFYQGLQSAHIESTEFGVLLLLDLSDFVEQLQKHRFIEAAALQADATLSATLSCRLIDKLMTTPTESQAIVLSVLDKVSIKSFNQWTDTFVNKLIEILKF